MNKVILIGRLVKDVQVGKGSSGISIAQFTIAVNRNYKNKEGKIEADFINCIAFRNTAEFISNYIKKGNQVCIEGKLQTRTYEKDGKKNYITEVLVENTTLLEKKEKVQEKVQEVNEFDTMKTKTEYKDTVELQDVDLPW